MIPILGLVLTGIGYSQQLNLFEEIETNNNPSPRPKNVNPKHRNKKVELFGLKFRGFFELQETFCIFFIVKNIFFTIIYTFLN